MTAKQIIKQLLATALAAEPLSFDKSIGILKLAMRERHDRGGDNQHILNALQICEQQKIAMETGRDC